MSIVVGRGAVHAACVVSMDGDVASTQGMPPACIVSSRCAAALEYVQGVHVMHLPPDRALLFANSTRTELPAACCPHSEAGIQHKVVPAFWELASHVQDAHLHRKGFRCAPQASPSHACPVLQNTSSAHSPLVAFEVHLVPAHAMHQPKNCVTRLCQAQLHRELAERVSSEWHELLQTSLGSEDEYVLEHSDGFLIVYVPPQRLVEAAEALAAQPLVASITPRRAHTVHDLRQVSLLLQSSGGQASAPAASDSGLQFWSEGLTGKNQVIGLGDSGIDMQHCAFKDPAVPFESFQVGDARIPFFASDEHRKLQLYYMYGDGEDDTRGHGTHVAAIAAGAPPASSKAQQGVAPGAKLAFFDLGSTSDQTVTTPYDLDADYFSITYDAKARIHAGSWGSNAVHYDSDCVGVDRFAVEHPDFLPVFSAGNFGSLQDAYNTTVNSPALAKNTIAVGNALPGGYGYTLPVPAVKAYVLSFVIGSQPILDAVVAAADFSADWSTFSAQPVPLVLSDPIQACEEFAVSAGTAQKVVLVERGGCGFGRKADAVARSGAVAMLVGNTGNTFLRMQRQSTPAGPLPVASIPLSTHELLLSLLSTGRQVSVLYSAVHDLSSVPSSESVDLSSSQGPTIDGRVKPDLVAPGTTSAASVGSECSSSVKSGTSMAAPVVAASAALVRQYFSEGFYPGGKKGDGAAHEASGPLVKAVLIGGAHEMQGISGADGMPMAVPSPAQGWGRVDLSGSLPLEDGVTVSNLQVVDQADLRLQGSSHLYCIEALGGPLTVTLVWHDQPAAPTAKAQLLNDLDLEVRFAGLGGLKVYSGGSGQPDRVNNVERVRLAKTPVGHVAISVKAHRLMKAPQMYSLVVQGDFTGILRHEKNPALLGGSAVDEEGSCIILAAEITLKPDALTADSNPGFGFKSISGGAPVLGFECKLVSPDAPESALSDWSHCESPTHYSGLQDGSYTFSVRIKEEELADSFDFSVDVSPPETTILQSLGFNSSSPLAMPLPPADSSRQIAAFAIGVADRSTVKLKCHVTGTGKVEALSWAPEFAVGKDYPCTSPQIFSVTSSGQYSFSVRGTDAVGNFQLEPTVYPFDVSYGNGTIHTLVEGAPWGLTANTTHNFALRAVKGTADGVGQDMASWPVFQVSVANLTVPAAPVNASLPQSAPQWMASNWTSTQGPQFQFTAPADGEYRLQFRAFAPALAAGITTWRLTIDSTPPSITFLVAPPKIMLHSVVVMRVEADEENVAWQCALLDGDFPSVSAEVLLPCNMSVAGTIEYDELTDGQQYTLAVRAVDRVGNASPVAVHRFLVDLSAPRVHALAYENATRGNSVEFSFGVSDGAAGTGIEQVQCGVRWLGNGATASIDWADCDNGVQPATGGEDCFECFWYSRTVQAETEGMWGFSVHTRDKVGQAATSEEAIVVVDRTSPAATWQQGRVLRNPSPPTVTLYVTALDKGAYKSGMHGALCGLQRKGRKGGSEFREQAAAEVVLDGTGSGEGGDDDVRFQFVDTAEGAQDASLGAWYVCGLPVHFQSVPTGKYDAYVKPLDWAGNVGPVLTRNFTVDASLDPAAAITLGSSKQKLKGWELALLIVAAGLMVGLLAFAAVWSSRKRWRSRQVSAAQLHHRYYYDPPSTSHGWSAELSAEIEKQERDRYSRALEASLLDAGLAASKAQQRHDTELQLAYQASMRE